MKINFKEKYLIILVASCFISIGFYYSYAVFVTKQLQENVVVVKMDNTYVTLNVNNNDNKITINNNSSLDFKINLNNKHNTSYNYLVLVKGLKPFIKVSSTDEVKGEIQELTNKELNIHVDNNSDKSVKLEFIVKVNNNSNIYKDDGYSYINDIDNYDHTKANKPEFGNLKLLPVSYKVEDNEGYWYKTDVNNQNDLWYSYENGIWANAVLLSNSDYNKYKNMSIGTKIEISDILGFYVWIPRFKYYVINSSSYTNYERMTNVIFEEGNNSTGTVECFDRISNPSDKHVFSEVCSDEYYDHIYDNLSTYTHPAFKNETGFWVSKFLMGEGEKIIPNINILKKNISDANMISEKHSNSHVLTNMEYGAVILLSNSSYGKTGNPLYQDEDNYTFTRIYANTYEYEVTGCSSEYNSRSKNIITEKTKNCIKYNDLNNYSHISNSISYQIGYAGAGASTTGTIYGVYDLASIDGEIVSGFVVDSTGNINSSLKYYDLYSYSEYIGKIVSSSNIYNLYRYKLGDAIREHYRSFSEYGMWNDGVLNQKKNSGILVRGAEASVYSVSIEDSNYIAPFRLVLIP